jgi:xanthine dehydrogenase/oxidase
MAADPTKPLSFVLNGTPVTVADPDPRQTLLDYLRSPEIGLTGAKASCGEGGCGACTVLLARYEQGSPCTDGWGNVVAGNDTGLVIERTVNACLTPLCSLDGAAVTTIEGLADERGAPHPIALRLAEKNGSQCGYCSPGWVMSMHALLRREPHPPGSMIEDVFDGHICRCTGYRAILDAMQSFAAERGEPARQSLCAHRPVACTPCGPARKAPGPARFGLGPDRWRRVVSLAELGEAWAEARRDGFAERLWLVAGNTAAALDKEPDEKPRFIVDISAIPELSAVEDGSADGMRGLLLGGAVTFARAIAELGSRAKDSCYAMSRHRCEALSAHLLRAANAQVRNRATLGGHLGLYLAHCRSSRSRRSPFLSDLLPLLVALEARVLYAATPDEATAWLALEDFLNTDAPLPVVVHAVLVPFAPGEEIVGADRVARRPQNAKPLVSAAWRLDLDERRESIRRARLAYCGLGVGPVRAPAWERNLEGRALEDLWAARLDGALSIELAACATTSFRDEDIAPMTGEEIPAPDRRRLARDLFQRFLVQGFRSGPRFDRTVSTGKQIYSEDDDPGPLGEEMPKLEGKLQTAGRALYTADLPGPPGTLAACYVTSRRSAASFRFRSVRRDLTRRLLASQPDFVDYIAADVLDSSRNHYRDEELLAKTEVTCFGQPIAVVLGRSLRAAKEAAKAIDEDIAYSDARPVLALAAARARNLLLDKKRRLERPREGLGPMPHVERSRGTMRTGAQAHFYMEPQAILAVPDDDGGITLTASSQHLEACQKAVADALDLPAHKVRVKTARLGGGFGGKETRTPPIAAVAALAAMYVRRPVRLVLERDPDTTIVGYRHPFEGGYDAAYDRDGRIHELNLEFTLDGGNSKDVTQHVLDLAVLSADGAYSIPRFRVDGASYRTSRMTRTAMRTFGVTQCSLIRETAIERVAHELGMLPEDVRQLNFYHDSRPDHADDIVPYGQKLTHCIINDVWQRLREDSCFDARARRIAEFNAQSPWRKRGISMLPIKYGVAYTYVPYNQGSAYVAIYAKDGTILVHTGAVEMGQGVNTKLAQLVADVLGVRLEMIEVAPSSTEVIPNASSSGASTGADLHGGALMKACKILRERLTDMCRAEKANAPDGWEQPDGWRDRWPEIIRLAYDRRLNLSAQAHYQSPRLTGYDFDGKPGEPFLYFTYSAACSEVEIDVLTGEFNVRRADILYDAGRSLNPVIDTGQIQGGFIQGMGNVTTEEVYYDDSGGNGAPLNSNFWNYKPPCCKTIPAQFNTRIYQYDNDELNALPGMPFAVWRSKSTGEPPAVLANSVFFAIRHAIAAARQAQGWPHWFEFDAPATVARVQRACREHEPVAPALAPAEHAR